MVCGAVGKSSAPLMFLDGYVAVVEDLLSVQNNTYAVPTILVAANVEGEEEIPDGVAGILTLEFF